MKIAQYLALFILYPGRQFAAQTHGLKFRLVQSANGTSLGKVTGMTRDRHGAMWFTDENREAQKTMVMISIKDNGNGIPQKLLDKIFQTFFTTKPVGQGTGLGLSLSYDIVKAHGGELKVETKEGEGSEFAISIMHN